MVQQIHLESARDKNYIQLNFAEIVWDFNARFLKNVLGPCLPQTIHASLSLGHVTGVIVTHA